MRTGSIIGQNRAVKTAWLGMALIFAGLPIVSVPAMAATPSAQAEALFKQGKSFHDGTGVTRDLSKARSLYEQAAAQNHNFARINLGYMYFTGEGVAQDYEQSRSWYYRAAIDGDKDAQKMMIVFYENGLGVLASPDKAAFWRAKTESASTPAKAAPAQKIVAKAAAPKPKTVTKPAGTYPAAKAIVEKPAAAQPKPNAPQAAKAPIKVAANVQAKAPAKSAVKTPAKVVADAPKPVSAASKTAISKPSTQSAASGPAKTVLGTNADLKAANPVASLNAPATAVALPQGASLSLIAIMAVLAFAGALWFLTQLSKLLVSRDKHRFAVAFYEHHREDLRSTFLRIPEEQRLHRYIDDPWVVSVSVLMIRFAQSRKDSSGKPFKIAKRIVDALRQSPLKARQDVFGIMPFIQNLIMLDINSSENEGTNRDTIATLLARAVKLRSHQAPASIDDVALSPAE